MSVAIRILPRYLNFDTLLSGTLYASNVRSEFSLVSFSASRRLFLFAPLRHCAVPGCRLFSALRGTCMSHLAHRGWGKFPYSRITTVSRICRCTKCTRFFVLVASFPGHPSTGHVYGNPFSGKDIRYSWGDCSLGRGGLLASSPCRPPMLSHQMTRQGADLQLLSALLARYLLSLPFSV